MGGLSQNSCGVIEEGLFTNEDAGLLRLNDLLKRQNQNSNIEFPAFWGYRDFGLKSHYPSPVKSILPLFWDLGRDFTTT